METIKFKCPNCGILLGAKGAPKDLDKIVTCPNCKEKNKFRDFKQIASKPVTDETELSGPVKKTLGQLVDETTHRRYQLHEGINLIGRMTYKNPPKADVPIVTEDMGLSRSHLYIQVLSGKDGRYHYYTYNASNANATYLNDVLLEEGNKEGLKTGDKIKSSKTVLRFEGEVINDITEI